MTGRKDGRIRSGRRKDLIIAYPLKNFGAHSISYAIRGKFFFHALILPREIMIDTMIPKLSIEARNTAWYTTIMILNSIE